MPPTLAEMITENERLNELIEKYEIEEEIATLAATLAEKGIGEKFIYAVGSPRDIYSGDESNHLSPLFVAPYTGNGDHTKLLGNITAVHPNMEESIFRAGEIILEGNTVKRIIGLTNTYGLESDLNFFFLISALMRNSQITIFDS